MAGRLVINGAIGPTQGFYFFLLEAGDDDDESILACARRVGDSLEIEMLSDAHEFVSIDAMPGEAFEGALVCALTADGTLMFSDGVESRSEVVVRNPPRRLKTVRFVGGVLYVAGFGGQVFRRRDDEPWEDISFDVPELVSGHGLFYHVVPGPDGTALFGGIFLHTREITDAMRAALDASDGKLYLKLKRASKKADHMLVAVDRDGWEILFTDHPGVVSWVWPKMSGGFYLVADTGDVWATDDFRTLEHLLAPETPAPFDDIKAHHGEPLFLQGEQLWRLGSEGLTAFEPALPGSVTRVMAIWSSPEGLIAVEKDAIWSLDDDQWKRLELHAGSQGSG